MKYLILLFLLSACVSNPSEKLTPFQKCKENAKELGIYEYSYAKQENDGSYSCVIPLENSPETIKRINDENEKYWDKMRELDRLIDPMGKK